MTSCLAIVVDLSRRFGSNSHRNATRDTCTKSIKIVGGPAINDHPDAQHGSPDSNPNKEPIRLHGCSPTARANRRAKPRGR